MLDVKAIESVITRALQEKISSYNPEPNSMPFHTRLLGRDRMALYSFIHSLSTSFGTKIFERVALQLAADRFTKVEQQKSVGKTISTGAQTVIAEIVTALRSGNIQPNASEAVKQIRLVARTGDPVQIRLPKVDIYLEEEGEIVLIELKTAKPNVDGFEKVKQNLLEWIAAIFYQDIGAQVTAFVGIPYNPDYPKPYARWTLRGMLEIENNKELKVADELWDFFAGEPIYNALLDCFERVGIEMREEIDAYFKRFT